MEQTLVIIKPDAVQRGLIGNIISRIERRGLKIAEMVMFHCWKELAEQLYIVHKGKDFFDGQVAFMCSSPIVAMIIEGRNALSQVRHFVVGSVVNPGTIRGDFANSVRHNLVHASDSPEAAKYEITCLEILWKHHHYELDSQKWVYTEEERSK